MKKAILCALSDLRSISQASMFDRDWELTFAPNSEHAVNALSKSHFEAIVTDFVPEPNTPGSLLERVLNRFPDVMRVLLWEPSGKGAMKTDGLAHQYLVKPCSPDVLVSAVDRARLVSSWMAKPAVKTIFTQMKRLPSVPNVYLRLMKKLQSPDTCIDELGGIIAEDFNLTAKVLQIVNSAAMGLNRTVTTPQDAVGFLGIERTKGLVLVANAFSSADSLKASRLSVESLWQHSLNTAKLAREIARDQPGKFGEEAFTAGLLHDVGKLLLAVNLTEQYNQILQRAEQEHTDLEVIEKEVLGVTHGEIGACVLGIWGLPSRIVEAIAFHHAPEERSVDGFSTLTAVHVANGIVYESAEGGRQGSTGKINMQYLRDLAVVQHLDSWRQKTLDAAAAA